MSELAPEAAAPKFARAALAFIAPVPPPVIGIGVTKPVKAVMSLLIPDFAATKFDLAAVSVIPPVPPDATGIGELRPEIVPPVIVAF